MPALVNSRLGSLPGTSGALGTIVCPRSRKKLRNDCRIWSPVTGEGLSAASGGGNLRPGRRRRARAVRDGRSIRDDVMSSSKLQTLALRRFVEPNVEGSKAILILAGLCLQ